MQILYLDASGDSGRYDGKNTKHFVLAGVALTPDMSFGLGKIVRNIINLHFESLKPEERPRELHYNHLIQNKYPYNKINSKALADDVFQLIINAKLTIFAISINKELHYIKYARPYPVREYALQAMTNRF